MIPNPAVATKMVHGFLTSWCHSSSDAGMKLHIGMYLAAKPLWAQRWFQVTSGLKGSTKGDAQIIYTTRSVEVFSRGAFAQVPYKGKVHSEAVPISNTNTV
eukprot:5800286-Amphidinium_carterae.1